MHMIYSVQAKGLVAVSRVVTAHQEHPLRSLPRTGDVTKLSLLLL